jgi:hypothetical protein
MIGIAAVENCEIFNGAGGVGQKNHSRPLTNKYF